MTTQTRARIAVWKNAKHQAWDAEAYPIFSDGTRAHKPVKARAQTRAEALERCAQKVAKIEGVATFSKESQTLREFITYWLKYEIEPEYAANTVAVYQDMAARILRAPVLPELKMADVSAQHVQQFMVDLKNADVSAATRRMAFSVLRRVFNRAMEPAHRLVQTSPCAGLKAPKAQSKAIRFWTPAEVDQFVAATRADTHGLLFEFAIHMGMRQGEIFGLGWENVDLKSGVIHVRKQIVEVKGKIVGRLDLKTKGSKRTITLTPQAKAALQDQRLAMMKRGTPNLELVFVNEDGGALLKENVRRAFNRAIKKAGVKYISFHDMRHTHATLAISAGVDVKTLQARLGHASATLTLDTYGHLFEARDREVAAKFGALLGGGK